jgi:hypothetical protein
MHERSLKKYTPTFLIEVGFVDKDMTDEEARVNSAGVKPWAVAAALKFGPSSM